MAYPIFTRLNERSSRPNPHINFIHALPSPAASSSAASTCPSEALLNQVAAFAAPIMTSHSLRVNRLAEHGSNPEFLGRNFNAGALIELVLRNRAGGFYSFKQVCLVMAHELAHCRHMNHGAQFWGLCRRLEGEMRDLWKSGFVGDGIWGRGVVLGTGQTGRSKTGIDLGDDDLPSQLCGGTFRSVRRQKKNTTGGSKSAATTARRRSTATTTKRTTANPKPSTTGASSGLLVPPQPASRLGGPTPTRRSVSAGSLPRASSRSNIRASSSGSTGRRSTSTSAAQVRARRKALFATPGHTLAESSAALAAGSSAVAKPRPRVASSKRGRELRVIAMAARMEAQARQLQQQQDELEQQQREKQARIEIESPANMDDDAVQTKTEGLSAVRTDKGKEVDEPIVIGDSESESESGSGSESERTVDSTSRLSVVLEDGPLTLSSSSVDRTGKPGRAYGLNDGTPAGLTPLLGSSRLGSAVGSPCPSLMTDMSTDGEEAVNVSGQDDYDDDSEGAKLEGAGESEDDEGDAMSVDLDEPSVDGNTGPTLWFDPLFSSPRRSSTRPKPDEPNGLISLDSDDEAGNETDEDEVFQPGSDAQPTLNADDLGLGSTDDFTFVGCESQSRSDGEDDDDERLFVRVCGGIDGDEGHDGSEQDDQVQSQVDHEMEQGDQVGRSRRERFFGALGLEDEDDFWF